MADVFTTAKRSLVMAAIRSRGNTATELKLRALLRRSGLTGWRRHAPLPGRPDFVFPTLRVAVFVDGCFWHGCPRHYREPKSRTEFWRDKIGRNAARDRAVARELRRRGWIVVRIWEHALSAREAANTVARLRRALARSMRAA